jgi:membrane fusion protein, copper/silver efflux system
MNTETVSRKSQVKRAAVGGSVLLAAVLVAFVATRGAPESAADTGHNHGAPAAGVTAAPVLLTDAQAQRIGVTFAVAELGSVKREIRTVGQITFDETRVGTIALKIDGWVERLYVNSTGQPIARGQPLLSLYSPMLVSAQEELLLAARLARDVAGGTAEAQQSARDLLASARRRLALWDIPENEIATIERSGEVRRALTMRAPLGGFVLEKNVFVGQRIMAGDAIYRVADLGTVWVEGEIFEQDLAAVSIGQMVHTDLQALPSEHHMGRITYIYPTLNPETRTARMRVELKNPGLRLKPGMYATLRIDGATRDQVLTVPRTAVLATGERSIVFVRRGDGRLEPRDVVVGMAGVDRVEILSGLVAGEQVVASATFLIDAESNLGAALSAMSGDDGAALAAPSGGPGMRGVEPTPAAAAPRSTNPPAPSPPRADKRDAPPLDHTDHSDHSRHED